MLHKCHYYYYYSTKNFFTTLYASLSLFSFVFRFLYRQFCIYIFNSIINMANFKYELIIVFLCCYIVIEFLAHYNLILPLWLNIFNNLTSMLHKCYYYYSTKKSFHNIMHLYLFFRSVFVFFLSTLLYLHL